MRRQGATNLGASHWESVQGVPSLRLPQQPHTAAQGACTLVWNKQHPTSTHTTVTTETSLPVARAAEGRWRAAAQADCGNKAPQTMPARHCAGRGRLAGPRTWMWELDPVFSCERGAEPAPREAGGGGGGSGHDACSRSAKALVGQSCPPAQCGCAATPTENAGDEHAGEGMHTRGKGADGFCVGKCGLQRRMRGAGSDWRGGMTGRFAVLSLFSMAALAPREVSGQIRYFNPVYRFGGQELFLCNDPLRPRRNPQFPDPIPMEWASNAEQWSPGSIPVECSKRNIEPELVTIGEGRMKACTHDLTVRYKCDNLGESPGCVCFGNCLPIDGLPGECLDVVFALEDTWTYLGIHIEHGPGTPGVYLPFIGQPSYHLLFRLSVRFGELELLDTLHTCTWRAPEKPIKATNPATGKPISLPDPRDTQFNMIKDTCDVTSLPGEWGTPTKKPYHIRYIRFTEQNFVNTMMSLEFSGMYEIVDPLIRLVRYKARPNENSERIKSPIYNKLSSRMLPYEMLQIDVFNTIQSSGRPSTDRYGLP